ncbi:MAG: CPBP family intramembrane metalloprotease [Nitrospirae bacterium]|nr:CPBP family intramembrane metalloprotease [Nitrospirota bacterium]
MMEPGPGPHAAPTQAEERGAVLALLPIAATLDFYALPAALQEQTLVQFAPQILAYLAFGLWATQNRGIAARLGLEQRNIGEGLRWGLLTGLLLGCLNSVVILSISPSLGYDIGFLITTPHAQLPLFVMVPWFICLIALFVEINFRGFMLGRLLSWGRQLLGPKLSPLASAMALGISAITFAFDPFMVNTFQHLHWIALWDGLIWGIIWLRTNNLYATIIAHAVEVLVMYCAIRATLMP